MHIRQRALTTKNGQVGTLAQSESIGIGIRVLAKGAWGFASTDKLTREGVSACAAQAVSIAKASAVAKRGDVKMVPENAYIDSWQAPLQKDPFEIPLESQLDQLLKADAAMRAIKGITLTETDMQFRKIDCWFASSIGSPIPQRKTISRSGIVAPSLQAPQIQKRPYPHTFRSHHPHPNFAGTRFLTLDKLNKLKYGSEIVNVVADARLAHGPGLGSFAYDDEGVPAQCTDIIKDGQFRGYLSNREMAQLVGLNRSSGTMRTECWNRLPIIRMTNISIKPGSGSPEELIAGTDDGIWMETNPSWSIADRRYQFQFSTETAWEIQSGKKVRMLKTPTYP